MTKIEAMKMAEDLIWSLCKDISEEDRLNLCNTLSQAVRWQQVSKFTFWLDKIIEVCNELKEAMINDDKNT
ncbi:MAG: hypothetical protein NC453_21720 [Muribaculum sp.]|nr:hypothetical protein [Muribaculum sp.]